jgi:hypothetical protein
MVDYYILSLRKKSFAPAQCCLIEFEDVLVECCQATLIAPDFSDGQFWVKNFIEKFVHLTKIDLPKPASNSHKQVLILVALSIWDCDLLNYMPKKWRERFDVVVTYIFDAMLPKYNDAMQSKIAHSKLGKNVKLMDYFFIPMTGSIQSYTELFQIPVALIPMAADVSKFGSNNHNRWIDVMGYGRQFEPHSKILENTYNNLESHRTYYHTNHMSIEKINNFYEHRRLFWKLLNNSHITLAYDVLTTPSERLFLSFVGQRWFECLAAGCMIIGRRPVCPEVNDLLNWEDATIEVPDDSNSLIPFVEDLLNDKERLQSVQNRNYLNALGRHDWRYRIADMLNHLGLKQPIPLQRSLASLQEKYETVKKSLNY